MKSALTRPPGGQGRILAVDPGKNSTGLAYFHRGELTYAVLERDPFNLVSPEEMLDEVVVEVPRAYGPSSPVDPNDLIMLGLLAGFIAGVARANPLTDLWFIHPQDWKGQTPKTIDNKRTLRHLYDKERQIVGAKPNHNVLDAVGIGLWALGRRK